MKLDSWQRYTPPPYKKVLYSAAISISALGRRRGRHAHAYGICAPFYCISLKKIFGGGITLPGVWFQGTLPGHYSEFCLYSWLTKQRVNMFYHFTGAVLKGLCQFLTAGWYYFTQEKCFNNNKKISKINLIQFKISI